MARGKKSPYTSARRPPSRKGGINWKIWAPIVGVLITAVVSVIVAAINNWCNWFPSACEDSTPTPTITQAAMLPPELKIMSVEEEELLLPRLDSVNGTYSRVPEDQQIWLIVMADNLCYPQDGPAEMLRAGIWEHGPVTFPIKGEQQLRVALVTAEAAVELRSAVGREGIRCDRSGVEIIDSVTVVVSSSPVTPSGTATPTSERPWVEIMEPSNGLVIHQRRIAPVHGRYGGFEEEDQLWLVVFVGANYYVQNGPALLTPANGTWIHADIYVGEEDQLPEAKQFAVIPVIVHSSEDRAWFRERRTGLAAEDLPDTVTVLPYVTVTRTR